MSDIVSAAYDIQQAVDAAISGDLCDAVKSVGVVYAPARHGASRVATTRQLG